MRVGRLFLLTCAFFFLTFSPAVASEHLQVPGLIDLKTTYGDGDLDLESLVELAKERDFEVLFISDHDRVAMEYGLSPLRRILRKRVELPSINLRGADNYLYGIRRVQEKYPNMIIIPGSDTAPFYFWTGSYFKKNLTAHQYERHFLTVGLEKAEDYKHLPILHNGFSTQYIKNSLPIILPSLVPLVLGLLLVKRKGIFRVCGLLISGFVFLFIINTAPFKSSPFDQYHGDQGIAPYQLVIDYVASRGGFTFWNYPETQSGVRKMGPIFLNTPPHPEVLWESKGYTGFAALYGDNITVTEPGGIWDKVLLEYCRGERDRPVWGISTEHFHKEGGAGEKLGNFPTVFLVRKRTKRDILFAMREGKMYACRGRYPQRMILDEFAVCSPGCESRAISGDEIVLTENPRIRISIDLKEKTQSRVRIRLIRSGELIKTFRGSLPMEIDYEDQCFAPGKKMYYRIDARGSGALVSNPIFVSCM
jgi:hypothetical protein